MYLGWRFATCACATDGRFSCSVALYAYDNLAVWELVM
jgi:hypothetical protein